MLDCSYEVKQKKKGKRTLFRELKLSLPHLPVALPSMLLGCEKMLTTWICIRRTEVPQKATDILPMLKF